MNSYIAAFYTHFAALTSYKKMSAAGVECALAPVPRYLSSNCGTCLRYAADGPMLDLLHEDYEKVVRVDGGTVETVAENA